MTTPPPTHTGSKRPRGGELWRHRDTGEEVAVACRRTVNPMGGVRPHSDMRWSLVAFANRAESIIGTRHESDFVRDYEYVGRHV